MLQIYGRKKCSATRKAMRFFNERRVQFQNFDLDLNSPGKRELDLFIQVVGAENLIDQSAKAYRSRGLAFMDFDPVAELNEDPALLRTPIVRSGRLIVVGENQTEWGVLAKSVS